MPRPIRICFAGALYHVFQRGNNKECIFVDDADRWHFLKLCLEAKMQFGYFIYCYALMGNHFHMMIETPNPTPLSKIMQYIEGSYAMYFNKRHEHKGHLFQGRFRDILVEKERYMLALSCYIHLNPVKAGLAASPEDYKWSSFDIYAGRRTDRLVDTAKLLNCFDELDHENARNMYKEYVAANGPAATSEKDWLEANLLRSRFLGSMSFLKQFQKRGQTPFVLDGKMGL